MPDMETLLAELFGYQLFEPDKRLQLMTEDTLSRYDDYVLSLNDLESAAGGVSDILPDIEGGKRMKPSFSPEQIYKKYKPTVMAYISARVQCNEDAEDICGDVFVKLFGLLESYDKKRASVSTLLYKITHDIVIDYYRRKRDHDELSEDHSVLPSLEDIIMDRERADELIKALSKLPQQQRDILILRFYRGWTLVRIAEEMGLSYNKVVSRQNSAFKTLRRMLGE